MTLTTLLVLAVLAVFAIMAGIYLRDRGGTPSYHMAGTFLMAVGFIVLAILLVVVLVELLEDDRGQKIGAVLLGMAYAGGSGGVRAPRGLGRRNQGLSKVIHDIESMEGQRQMRQQAGRALKRKRSGMGRALK